jgi:hypothetical protein
MLTLINLVRKNGLNQNTQFAEIDENWQKVFGGSQFNLLLSKI